jgi:hypothetical protein
MSTSRTTGLSEPTGSTKISLGTLGYICARNRQRAYDLLIKEFKKSRLTQADLARRLGKRAEVISRLLSRPRNWELDTFSALLFAISGGVVTYSLGYPLAVQDRTSDQKPMDPRKPVTKSEEASTVMNLKLNNPDIKEARLELQKIAA